jgi:hypothetical protein
MRTRMQVRQINSVLNDGIARGAIWPKHMLLTLADSGDIIFLRPKG